MDSNNGKKPETERVQRTFLSGSGDMDQQQRNRNHFTGGNASRGGRGDGNPGGTGRANSNFTPHRHRAALGSGGSFSTVPRGVAPNSINLMKLGKPFPNPFASKAKVLKRLQTAMSSSKSGSTSSSLLRNAAKPSYATIYPPRKPLVTSQDLRKHLERRREEKAKTDEEKGAKVTATTPKKSNKSQEKDEDDATSSRTKVLVTRDDDASSDSSLTVQIGGRKKKNEAAASSSSTVKTAEKVAVQDDPDLITLSSDSDSDWEKSDFEEVTKKVPVIAKPRLNLQESVEKLKLDCMTRNVSVKIEHEALAEAKAIMKASRAAERKGQCEKDINNPLAPTPIDKPSTAESDKVSSSSSVAAKESIKNVAITKDAVATENANVKEPEQRPTTEFTSFRDLNKNQNQKKGSQNPFSQFQWKVPADEGNETSTSVFSTGKVLLPTPPMFSLQGQQSGGGGDNGRGGDNGNGNNGGGWRTYKQVKDTESVGFKKRKFGRGGQSKFQNRHNNQRDREWGSGKDSGVNIQPAPLLDLDLSSEKAEDGKKGRQRTNKNMNNEPSSSAPFDPYQPTTLMPAPPPAVISQLYQNMLNTNITSEDIYLTHSFTPKFWSPREISNQANSNCFSSFVTTDSKFGNCLMPVMPRLEPPPESTPTPATDFLPTSSLSFLF